MAQAELKNGVALEYEVNGELSNPVIFIILGITDNITDWPPGLVDPLVAAGFCVVCHELRDSGLSSKFESTGYPDLAAAKLQLEKGERPDAPYTVHDVAEDALLLMDFLEIESACVVGYSYGSMVAQLLTLKVPQRVDKLVCLQGSNYNPDLPARLPDVEKAMLGATLEYPDREQQVDAVINLRIATNGSVHALGAEEARASAETSVARMYYPQGTARIILSRFATEPFYQQTQNIGCPTLILHADEDPIFNIEHGRDLAEKISGSRLEILAGAGHNHPLSLQPIIANHLIGFAGFSEE